MEVVLRKIDTHGVVEIVESNIEYQGWSRFLKINSDNQAWVEVGKIILKCRV